MSFVLNKRMIDLTGQVFGKLTALRPIGKNNRNDIIWEMQCQCGNIHIASSYNLRKMDVKSCGCLRQEIGISRRIEHKIENGIDLKFCGRCSEYKSLNLFSADKNKWDKLNGWCVDCIIDTQIQRKYGMTLENKQKLFDVQNGKCAICRKDFLKLGDACIDHDHKTEKVRGLLCVTCNRTLGLLKDDIKILRNAINYLRHKDFK